MASKRLGIPLNSSDWYFTVEVFNNVVTKQALTLPKIEKDRAGRAIDLKVTHEGMLLDGTCVYRSNIKIKECYCRDVFRYQMMEHFLRLTPLLSLKAPNNNGEALSHPGLVGEINVPAAYSTFALNRLGIAYTDDPVLACMRANKEEWVQGLKTLASPKNKDVIVDCYMELIVSYAGLLDLAVHPYPKLLQEARKIGTYTPACCIDDKHFTIRLTTGWLYNAISSTLMLGLIRALSTSFLYRHSDIIGRMFSQQKLFGQVASVLETANKEKAAKLLLELHSKLKSVIFSRTGLGFGPTHLHFNKLIEYLASNDHTLLDEAYKLPVLGYSSNVAAMPVKNFITKHWTDINRG